jgi:hypothetical protein
MKNLFIALWGVFLVVANASTQTAKRPEDRYPPVDGPPRIDLRDGLPGNRLPQPPRQPMLPPATAIYSPPTAESSSATQPISQVPAPMPLQVPPGTSLPAPIPGSPLPIPGIVQPAPSVVVPSSPAVASGLDQALNELRTAREELARERKQATQAMMGLSTEDETSRLKLRLRVVELLREMNKTPSKAGPAPVVPPPSVEPIRPPRVELTPTVGDPLELAQTRFRARQYQEALTALEAIDRSELTRRDQVWVQYLTACCLRHLGKLSEAAALYREVAASRDDPFLTDSAVWQLSFLRWREETQSAINELRR